MRFAGCWVHPKACFTVGIPGVAPKGTADAGGVPINVSGRCVTVAVAPMDEHTLPLRNTQRVCRGTQIEHMTE